MRAYLLLIFLFGIVAAEEGFNVILTSVINDLVKSTAESVFSTVAFIDTLLKNQTDANPLNATYSFIWEKKVNSPYSTTQEIKIPILSLLPLYRPILNELQIKYLFSISKFSNGELSGTNIPRKVNSKVNNLKLAYGFEVTASLRRLQRGSGQRVDFLGLWATKNNMELP